MLEGKGVEGWVESTSTATPSFTNPTAGAARWHHVIVGNERLLRNGGSVDGSVGGGGGGACVVEESDKALVEQFKATHGVHSSLIFVCVDNRLSAVLALSGEINVYY